MTIIIYISAKITAYLFLLQDVGKIFAFIEQKTVFDNFLTILKRDVLVKASLSHWWQWKLYVEQ